MEKLGDLSAVTSEQLQDLMKRKSLESLGFGNGNNQKVVSLSEVPAWIEKGFEYVTSIPPDKAIVSVPRG